MLTASGWRPRHGSTRTMRATHHPRQDRLPGPAAQTLAATRDRRGPIHEFPHGGSARPRALCFPGDERHSDPGTQELRHPRGRGPRRAPRSRRRRGRPSPLQADPRRRLPTRQGAPPVLERVLGEGAVLDEAVDRLVQVELPRRADRAGDPAARPTPTSRSSRPRRASRSSSRRPSRSARGHARRLQRTSTSSPRSRPSTTPRSTRSSRSCATRTRRCRRSRTAARRRATTRSSGTRAPATGRRSRAARPSGCR